MSIGIGAYAKKVLEDENSVMYEYGSYNWNEEKFRNKSRIYDGTILIQKECFVEPEIHQKIKRMKNGRKKTIVKRIPVNVEYISMIKKGQIQIENSKNCWQMDVDLQVDTMVLYVLYCLFLQYQEDGTIPQYIGYNV